MKRALKIFGWTLLGIVLAVVAVVTVACYVIFTPERLTPVARRAADAYMTCEHEIGQVDLTFFSTFPRFGLRADGLLIINPKAGAQNDTVVAAQTLIATVDVMEFLSHRNLHVHEAVLDGAKVNFYIAPDGTTNLTDIFVTSPDTAEEDTSAFSLPFDALRVDGMRLHADYITFVDDKDTIHASLGQTELSAKAESWDDMLIGLDAQDVCASLKGDTYADDLHVELLAPMAMNPDAMHFAFNGASLAVNEFAVCVEGEVTLQDSIAVDARIETGNWQIQPLLALVPETFTSGLKDLDVDGEASLQATVNGFLSDKQMPRVQAHLILNNGKGSYAALPYTLRDIALDVNADIRLTEGEQSHVVINSLKARTKQSALTAKGTLNDLMGDMLIDLALGLDAHLPDFAYFLPEAMQLDGRAKGTAKARIRLDDLTGMRLEKGRIHADIRLTDIRYAMDSMMAAMTATNAVIHIPNPHPSKPETNWARIDLQTEGVDFVMIDQLKANLKESAIRLETGNVMSNDPVLYAAVGLQSERPVVVEMDSMGGVIDAPQMSAYAEYNSQDSTSLHKAELNLACNALEGFYSDIKAALQTTQIRASVRDGKRVSAKLKTTALTTSVADELKARTADLTIEAGARYNKKGENALLQWNPRLKVNLKQGELAMPQRLPEVVKIPSVEFKYSNREMTIDNSRVELGKSDLSLKGNVRNIGKWFRHKAQLEGSLDIVSDYCDANQLLAWFSADQGSEEETSSNQMVNDQMVNDQIVNDQMVNDQMVNDQMVNDPEPFLVPTDVNLALTTHIHNIDIFNQTAHDLKGGLYLRDGTLILDEVGFVCRAAKLQLTAIYRTPRRNHLYLGFDYHMIDVDINELLTMIPNLEEMVPMLSSFKGAARFHLAAETYLNSRYQPKMSTLRGAASLTGNDLVVLDSETFDRIAKLLMFKKKTENRIDSINAELTVYKNEIDVYPLCVAIDNYMVALGGRHNTDMTFNYDINVLKPIYLGVNVSGNIGDLKIKLAKCRFAKTFRPRWYDKTDAQALELRQRIKDSMEKNLRIQ